MNIALAEIRELAVEKNIKISKFIRHLTYLNSFFCKEKNIQHIQQKQNHREKQAYTQHAITLEKIESELLHEIDTDIMQQSQKALTALDDLFPDVEEPSMIKVIDNEDISHQEINVVDENRPIDAISNVKKIYLPYQNTGIEVYIYTNGKPNEISIAFFLAKKQNSNKTITEIQELLLNKLSSHPSITASREALSIGTIDTTTQGITLRSSSQNGDLVALWTNLPQQCISIIQEHENADIEAKMQESNEFKIIEQTKMHLAALLLPKRIGMTEPGFGDPLYTVKLINGKTKIFQEFKEALKSIEIAAQVAALNHILQLQSQLVNNYFLQNLFYVEWKKNGGDSGTAMIHIHNRFSRTQVSTNDYLEALIEIQKIATLENKMQQEEIENESELLNYELKTQDIFLFTESGLLSELAPSATINKYEELYLGNSPELIELRKKILELQKASHGIGVRFAPNSKDEVLVNIHWGTSKNKHIQIRYHIINDQDALDTALEKVDATVDHLDNFSRQMSEELRTLETTLKNHTVYEKACKLVQQQNKQKLYSIRRTDQYFFQEIDRFNDEIKNQITLPALLKSTFTHPKKISIELTKRKIPAYRIGNKDGHYMIPASEIAKISHKKEGKTIFVVELIRKFFALLQSWNSVETITKVTIPKYSFIVRGSTAAQTEIDGTILPGGAEQIYVISSIDETNYGTGYIRKTLLSVEEEASVMIVDFEKDVKSITADQEITREDSTSILTSHITEANLPEPTRRIRTEGTLPKELQEAIDKREQELPDEILKGLHEVNSPTAKMPLKKIQQDISSSTEQTRLHTLTGKISLISQKLTEMAFQRQV